MLKLLGWLIKTTLFIGVVLVLGNLIRWNGKTVSDQVKTQIAHAERAAEGAGARTGDLVNQVKDWGNTWVDRSLPGNGKTAGRHDATRPVKETKTPADEISQSEREKLRALIHDLNHRREDHARK